MISLLAAALISQPPNIVLIVADDLGYGELGVYGQTKIRTPNIDQLAMNGIRFTQFYAGSAVCAPSRSVLMTGQHSGHTYIRNNTPNARKNNPHGEGQEPIPDSLVTLAELLKDAGYTTGGFGKWGLGGPDSEGAPEKQGFDRFYGYYSQEVAHNYYPTHLWDTGRRVPLNNNRFSSSQKLDSPPDSYAQFAGNDYAPDLIFDEALKFVDQNKSAPFFLYWPTIVPHVSLQVPDDSVTPYPASWDAKPYLGERGYLPHPRPRAAYAGMITRLDDKVGVLVDRLETYGLLENTLIIFTSDNGPTFNGGSDSVFFDSTANLRGLKGSVYEGGIRVPMIASWPGKIQRGVTTHFPSAFHDLLPTFTDLTGSPTPKGVDGKSLKDTLLGRPSERTPSTLYWELGAQQAIRIGDFKLVRKSPRNGEQTLELFNLRTDPFESTNLASNRPVLTRWMTRQMDENRTPSAKFPAKYDRKS